jgi:hypothetical protein
MCSPYVHGYDDVFITRMLLIAPERGCHAALLNCRIRQGPTLVEV